LSRLSGELFSLVSFLLIWESLFRKAFFIFIYLWTVTNVVSHEVASVMQKQILLKSTITQQQEKWRQY
jgi:hypothetical protein